MTAYNAPSSVEKGLGPKVDGLNPHLIAKIWEVDRKGKKIGNVTVFAPLTQAELETTQQWQSPFEQAGVESIRPTLAAMAQAGAFQPVMASLGLAGDGKSQVGDNAIVSKAVSALNSMEGRTGVTMVNSTQVFVGAPPARISFSMLFRAWNNPKSEVEQPKDQLVGWSLPKYLAPDGLLVNAINAAKGNGGWIDVLMPSETPSLVALHYKNRTYKPMVIESISIPLDSPITNKGEYASLIIPITLCSLTAWDRNTWNNTKVG